MSILHEHMLSLSPKWKCVWLYTIPRAKVEHVIMGPLQGQGHYVEICELRASCLLEVTCPAIT
jgi:hypothetical protein